MMNKGKRKKVIERFYGRKTLGAKTVYRLVRRSVKQNKPISVIRLGDVMAKLLARHDVDSLNKVAPFLGIRLPPSPELLDHLDRAVHASDIVGLSHYRESRKLIKMYMEMSGWKPRKIADSFINDQLYEKGYLHRLIHKCRVALVGRASADAARQLKQRGFKVVLTVNLDHADGLGEAMRRLRAHRHKYNLVLVGASVPGRILCSRLKRELRVSAVEIGHMMDAFANPKEWKKPNNRQRFKHRFLRKNQKRSETASIVRLGGHIRIKKFVFSRIASRPGHPLSQTRNQKGRGHAPLIRKSLSVPVVR